MAKPIAFATDAEWPQLTPDDQLAQAALAQLGVEAAPALWDAQLDWAQFQAVFIRSTWDYHVRPDEFTAWLARLEALQVPVWNPPAVIGWNMNKAYLVELERKGVRIVPSVWIEQGDTPSFQDVAGERSSPRLVLKPLVSANAYNTWVIENEADWQEKLAAIHKDSAAVAQEFMPEVQSEGEWSLLFFDGEFSHAVLKTPKAGDFRTQMNYGAVSRLASPDAALVAQARAVLDAVEPVLYARVDGVVRGGQLYLMELELIEPHLFLEYGPGAPQRFARAVQSRLEVVRHAAA